jgi:predicted transposase YdaD
MASSDIELYQLFKAEPRFLNVFVEMDLNETYTFEPITFKDFNRRCDGLLRSDNPDEATVIFEFQMQKTEDIYARIVSEMAMYHLENIKRKVCGVIVFRNPETDPDDHNWQQVRDTCPGLLKVLYLNQVYEDLKHNQPDSPLQAVFAPFCEKDPNLIRQNASSWSRQIHQLPYPKEQREIILKVFMSWLTQSLPDLSKKELKQMTSLTFDIKHTRFYKEVSEESRREGEFTGQLKLLRNMLNEGLISQETFDRKMNALKDQHPPEDLD